MKNNGYLLFFAALVFTGTSLTNLGCDSGKASSGGIGQACASHDDCAVGGAFCHPEVHLKQNLGFLDGYCLVFDCLEAPCPSGSQCAVFPEISACMKECTSDKDCRQGYGCIEKESVKVCLPDCTESEDCPYGYDCQDKICVENCTADSCATGERCADGRCIMVVEDGPGPNTQFPLEQVATLCPDLPELECSGDESYCGELVPFDPDYGPGYVDYPENSESWEDQYRSFIRRDNMILIKYAAAYVDCLAENWQMGNGEALGLVDMSEENGDIPGTSTFYPGHPPGTHTDGFDIDVAYYQVDSSDNRARAVCEHRLDGQEQDHCIAAPHLLDHWRTALFLGALFEHPKLRVVGADGQIGPILEGAIYQLCQDGWLSSSACSNQLLYWEKVDMGAGWYKFHHHHMHVSINPPTTDRSHGNPGKPFQDACITRTCRRPAIPVEMRK